MLRTIGFYSFSILNLNVSFRMKIILYPRIEVNEYARISLRSDYSLVDYGLQWTFPDLSTPSSYPPY